MMTLLIYCYSFILIQYRIFKEYDEVKIPCVVVVTVAVVVVIVEAQYEQS